MDSSVRRICPTEPPERVRTAAWCLQVLGLNQTLTQSGTAVVPDGVEDMGDRR